MSGTAKSTLVRRILDVLTISGLQSARRRTLQGTTPVETLEARQLLSAVRSTQSKVVYETATTPIVKSTGFRSAVGTTSSASLLQPLSETFNLSSRPSASKTIYLDFDGHTTSGTRWNTDFNNGNDFTTPAFTLDSDATTFTAAELIQIQQMWQRVVEDFAPFDVNVTTKDPPIDDLMNTGGGDTRWGVRVVIGGSADDWLKLPAGGIAYLGSFNDSIDTPTYAFSVTQGNDEQVIVETISHEAGHTLGLDHDGTATLGYYGGHGFGATSWGPIMGASFGISVTQWSKGEYIGADNQEDDLAIITTQNGFGYRVDDYGNTRLTATQFPTVKSGSLKSVNTAGVIERNTDQDWFSFTTTGGSTLLNFAGDALGTNLDIAVSLYDGTGTLITTVNPGGSLSATLSVNLPAGTYYVMVDGVGFGNLATGYSDYGSLGQYTVTGTITDTSSGTANGGTSIISGRVVSDGNANGILDGSDGGIGGVMLFIDLDGSGTFNAARDKSTRADSQGNFKFTGLLGGTYIIYQVTPTGWQQVAPTSLAQTVTVAADSTTSNVYFRNARPPVLSSLGSTVTYKSGSAPILLTTTGNVSDPDTSTFGGARLTVAITQNLGATDRLSVRNQGNSAGQVGLFGTTVRYAGKAVATLSGGIGGSNLVITFNSTTTLTILRAVLRNITFVATSGSPSKLTRTVAFTLTDGTGTTSKTVSKSVRVV